MLVDGSSYHIDIYSSAEDGIWTFKCGTNSKLKYTSCRNHASLTVRLKFKPLSSLSLTLVHSTQELGHRAALRADGPCPALHRDPHHVRCLSNLLTCESTMKAFSVKPQCERSSWPEARLYSDWQLWAPNPNLGLLWLVRMERKTYQEYLCAGGRLLNESQKPLTAPICLEISLGAYFLWRY